MSSKIKRFGQNIFCLAQGTLLTVPQLSLPGTVLLALLHSAHGVPAKCTTEGRCTSEFSTRFTDLPEVPHIRRDVWIVDLGHNRIKSLGAGEFRHLSDCIKLYLQYNLIDFVHREAFAGLTNLLYLNLEGNQISEIQQGTFGDLVKCTNLTLNNNLIFSVHQETFQGLAALKNLGLSNNRLSELQQGTFLSVPSLTELYLDDNLIRRLNTGMFLGLSHLKTLHLGDNLIHTIDQDTFKHVPTLRQLNLVHNRLTYLSPDIFATLLRPLTLFLTWPHGDSNRWNCDSLCWLKNEELHGTVHWWGRFVPRCAGPVSWDSLQCGDAGERLGAVI